ncbi:MAG: hypothetical protein A3E01_09895 [Gammaproteobacteria bacterium RIFCSPHIGHO2_12_FULL_63_22]|nr:MAG: hypothetical protein A3E01_09895 [Gammaproteobacteria bacterium RIFCSPHIGHO2_12_FULL_63_22]
MSDPNNKPAKASAAPDDQKLAKAEAIYVNWRNTHMNQIPVELFNRLEAVKEHLIADIAKAL